MLKQGRCYRCFMDRQELTVATITLVLAVLMISPTTDNTDLIMSSFADQAKASPVRSLGSKQLWVS